MAEFIPTHRHYKGGYYRVVSTRVRNEKDSARMVLYEDAKGQQWVRQYDEFMGKVTLESPGRTVIVMRYLPITVEGANHAKAGVQPVGRGDGDNRKDNQGGPGPTNPGTD